MRGALRCPAYGITQILADRSGRQWPERPPALYGATCRNLDSFYRFTFTQPMLIDGFGSLPLLAVVQ
jgi:hypothetical protein